MMRILDEIEFCEKQIEEVTTSLRDLIKIRNKLKAERNKLVTEYKDLCVKIGLVNCLECVYSLHGFSKNKNVILEKELCKQLNEISFTPNPCPDYTPYSKFIEIYLIKANHLLAIRCEDKYGNCIEIESGHSYYLGEEVLAKFDYMADHLMKKGWVKGKIFDQRPILVNLYGRRRVPRLRGEVIL
jgi:hypothetical protein